MVKQGTPPPRRRIRRGIVATTLALSLGVIAREFLVEGLVFPLRIVGGSMAPALPGERWSITCPHCGFPYLCGREFAPPRGRPTCPNCSRPGTPGLDNQPAITGRRVMVVKATRWWGPPRRWDLVATRDPAAQSQGASPWVVKRVVGLPGEVVTLRQGDVLIDGAIARKPRAVRHQLARPIHDDRYRVSRRPGQPMAPRWAPTSVNSQWRTTARGYSIESQQQANGPSPSERMDWLAYRHVPPQLALDRSLPTSQAMLDDRDGYNQGIRRRLNAISDAVLAGHCRLPPGTRLLMRYYDGRHEWQLKLDRPESAARLQRDGGEVVTAPLAPSHRDAEIGFRFLFGVCDGRVVFEVDEVPVITFDFTPRGPLRPGPHSFSLGTEHGGAEVTNLVILRDVYYEHPQRRPTDWQIELGPQELLLLGDNSPVSEDGRHWTAPPEVTDVIGRVMRWPRGDAHE